MSAADTLHALLARNRTAPVVGECPSLLRGVGRNDLPSLCRELGFTDGAEIGVWKGAFSAKFCAANPQMHIWCVDPWLPHPAWLDSKNSLPPGQASAFMAKAYREACEALRPFPHATIVRDFSADAARDVADESLDFVYIDGNHVEAAVREDLEAWAPKVRSGGFVAGHDYRAFPNKPTIHVIEAVQAYTQAYAIEPWFVLAADRTPSFLWIVP